MSTVTSDAKAIWQGRDEKAREQEAVLLKTVREHNAAAREDKLTGEIVFKVRYKDGGIIGRRTEVMIDEK